MDRNRPKLTAGERKVLRAKLSDEKEKRSKAYSTDKLKEVEDSYDASSERFTSTGSKLLDLHGLLGLKKKGSTGYRGEGTKLNPETGVPGRRRKGGLAKLK